MARVMTRMAKFLKDYNGAKGTRLVMMDFFTTTEMTTFTTKFLNNSRRPINSVGDNLRVVFGINDEVYDVCTYDTIT